MAIDNRDIDREEERQVERKKDENRRKLEQKMKYEPMKTFEAKLSEKSAGEQASKESALRDAHHQKKSKEEKDGLLNKIIGTVKDKGMEQDKSKVAAVHKQEEHEAEDKKSEKLLDAEFEVDEEDKTESQQKTDQKKGEVSEDGYRRVSEKDQQGEGGSGGFGSGEEGFSDGEQGFGSGSNPQDKDQLSKGKFSEIHGKVGGIKKGKFGQGGFNRGAKNFSKQNLDEIVSSVELGLNELGQEEFAVELTDEYFDGLRVSAVREEGGEVVLKFECPNIQVRSTFLKQRPQVHARLKAQGIQVKRVEVL